MTVLVTGTWRLLAERLVWRLRAAGVSVFVDGRDAPRRVDVIIDTACPPAVNPAPSTVAETLSRRKRLAQSALRGHADAIVLVSSNWVYPEGYIDRTTPSAPRVGFGRLMVSSEGLVDSMVSGSGVAVTRIRVPHVYGTSSPIFEYVADGTLPFAGDRDVVFSHLHVDDAADGLVAAARRGVEGTLCLSDRSPLAWGEVLDTLCRHRPGLRVEEVEGHLAMRARLLLGDLAVGIPSEITPGTGLRWSHAQWIDSASSWDALETGPRHASVGTGIPAVLDEWTALPGLAAVGR